MTIESTIRAIAQQALSEEDPSYDSLVQEKFERVVSSMKEGPGRSRLLRNKESELLRISRENTENAVRAWVALYWGLTSRLGQPGEKTVFSSPCLSFVKDFRLRYLRGTAEKALKFHTAYVFARAMDQTELPPMPSELENDVPGKIAGGWAWARIQCLMNAHCRGDVFRQAYDFLMTKTVMPRVSEDFVQGALDDHAKAMGAKDPCGPEASAEVQEWVEKSAIPAITRLVHEALGKRSEGGFVTSQTEKTVVRPSLPTPSLNASFETSQRAGGQMGACFGKLMHTAFTEGAVGSGTPIFDPFLQDAQGHKLFESRMDLEDQFGLLFDTRDLEGHATLKGRQESPADEPVRVHGSETDFRFPSKEPMEYHMNVPYRFSIAQRLKEESGWVELGAEFDDEYKTRYAGLAAEYARQVYAEAKKVVDRGFIYARPAPVCEPLKVRVVTLGEATPYAMALDMQRALHDKLRKLKLFGYIGHPSTQEDWQEAFARPLGPDEFFVSGDYKAATDNLSRRLIVAAWEAAADVMEVIVGKEVQDDGTIKWIRLPLRETIYYKMGKMALVDHVLVYSRGEKTFQVRQTNGQLMGSPMSFPFLCLINAAISGLSIGLNPLRTNEMRVNGDDIAFIATKETYAVWKQNVSRAGLTPSLGKNYTSRKVCIINSELRRYYEGEWHFEQFVNFALLWGYGRKGADAGEDLKPKMMPDELSARCNSLVSRFEKVAFKRSLVNQFLELHEEPLKEFKRATGSRVGYFVPLELGGYGLPRCGRAVEDWDLRWAATAACLDPETRAKKLPAGRSTQAGGFMAKELEHVRKIHDAMKPKRLVERPVDLGNVGEGADWRSKIAGAVDGSSRTVMLCHAFYRPVTLDETRLSDVTGRVQEDGTVKEFRVDDMDLSRVGDRAALTAHRISQGWIPQSKDQDRRRHASLLKWASSRVRFAKTVQKAASLTPMSLEKLDGWVTRWYEEQDDLSVLPDDFCVTDHFRVLYK
jgi:hypothetical protein